MEYKEDPDVICPRCNKPIEDGQEVVVNDEDVPVGHARCYIPIEDD